MQKGQDLGHYQEHCIKVEQFFEMRHLYSMYQGHATPVLKSVGVLPDLKTIVNF